ncbi:unnamed protein product [Cercospora beticola]|nr:unnamed protein product [Cercospora beticola]
MKARVIQSITLSALIGAAGALLAAFTRARSSVILANPTRLALLTARCAAFILRAKSSATSLMPCGAPCDRVPCSKRCKKVLGYGY